MGKVYSPEEVAAGRVPEPGAHEQAGRFVMSELIERGESDLYWDGTAEPEDTPAIGVESGMVYGSVAMGTATRRSDLDILISYHEAHARDTLPYIATVFDEVEERFRVHPEGNLFPVGALYDPNQHTIDPLFAEHLIAIQYQDEPRWSYRWPADPLIASGQRIDPEDKEHIRAIALRYVSAKATSFARSIVQHRQGADVDYHSLQRTLELPTALGRKILAATYEDEIGDEVISGDRLRVREMLFRRLEIIEWPGIAENGIEPLASLQARNEEYSDLLEQAIAGETSIEDYEAWIKAQVPETYISAYEACEAWRDILRLNLDRRNYGEEKKRFPIVNPADAY